MKTPRHFTSFLIHFTCVAQIFISCLAESVIVIKPTTLDNCKTHEDSLHVIDNFSKNEKGNLKPPCSASPDYCGCMKNRGVTPESCK